MNWSKMILTASVLVVCLVFAQTGYAQAPASKGNSTQKAKEKPAAKGTEMGKEADVRVRSEEGDFEREKSPIKMKREEKAAQEQAQGQDKARVKMHKGKAHGKNKGDVKGKDFGQDRAEEARSKKKPGKE